MDVLFRHTILGEGIRIFESSPLLYAEERDAAVIKNFISLQDAESLPPHANETSALLTNTDDVRNSEIYLVDWYGPNDPENPMNWPLATKVVVTVVISIVTVFQYTGATFWSVCVDDAVAVFQVPEIIVQLGTSLYVLGFGLGPMVFSPLSEMPSVGRLKVYFWSTMAFILCQLPIPLCNNIAAILVLRFFTGVLCSPVLAVGGGTIADMYGPSSRGYPMSIWELATWAAGALGPVFAAFTYERFGYKGPMWQLVILALIALVLIVCLLPETSPPAILHQRAQRLRKGNRDMSFVTLDELEASQVSILTVIRGLFVKSITLNFQEPIVFVLNLYVALVFAIFFGMLESYPYVFKREPHNFSSGQVGLTFVAIFCGGTTSMFLYFLFLRFHQHPRFDKDGNIRPEERLLPAIPGGFFVPLGLFWYGWTTQLHWIIPVLGGFWFGLGVFTIFMAMLSYLPDAYPSVAATVIAGNCLMRAVLGASFPLFTVQYYEWLGAGVATSVLGVLGLLFVPCPIILFYRGRELREKSRNARKDI